VQLKIYDILGNEIKTVIDAVYDLGVYSLIWDGRDKNNNRINTGIYNCVLTSKNDIYIKKIIFIK
jgi:flagellar hook assembly protein FlgD